MQIVFVNGTRVHLTWREARAQFQHPMFVALMLALCTLVVGIGPYDRLLNFDALKLAVFYGAAFGSFFGLLLLALFVCYQRDWPAYSLGTVGVAWVGSTCVGLWTALLLGAPMPAPGDLFVVAGFNLVICLLGDILYSAFVMPRVLADLRGLSRKDVLAAFIASESGRLGGAAGEPSAAPTRAPPAPFAPPAPERVTMFGQTFAAEEIRLIEAEEHYVAITLHTGARQLLRGRIADAVAVLPDHLGRRVHRSYWVATSAVVGFRQTRTGAHLLLTDGASVPVARGRIAEVRGWTDTTLPRAQMKKAPQRVPS